MAWWNYPDANSLNDSRTKVVWEVNITFPAEDKSRKCRLPREQNIDQLVSACTGIIDTITCLIRRNLTLRTIRAKLHQLSIYLC